MMSRILFTLMFACTIGHGEKVADDSSSDPNVTAILEQCQRMRKSWSYGKCSWLYKEYRDVSGNFLELLENDKFRNQLPAYYVSDKTQVNTMEACHQYILYNLSPSFVRLEELIFNENGWRLNQYIDFNQLPISKNLRTYFNDGLHTQAITSTIQIGDIRWSKTPTCSSFKQTSGVMLQPRDMPPIAFGNVLPMLFVDNIFLPIDGRITRVDKKSDNEFLIVSEMNQGITRMNIDISRNFIRMTDQYTHVDNVLYKAGGEFGTITTNNNSVDEVVSLPKFSIDISKRGESDNVDIIIREFIHFSFDEIKDNELILGID